MKPIGLVSAVGLICLGVLHTLVTPSAYSLDSVEALWFAGTGVMLIASGLLNILVPKVGPLRWPVFAVLGINLLGLLLALFAVRAIGQPQAYLLVVLFGATCITTGHAAIAKR